MRSVIHSAIALSLMASIGCVPPYTLTSKDPLMLIDGHSFSSHTIQLSIVVEWIKEGKLGSFMIPMTGPAMYHFNNGVTVGIYKNTPERVVKAFNEAISKAPNSTKIIGVIA